MMDRFDRFKEYVEDQWKRALHRGDRPTVRVLDDVETLIAMFEEAEEEADE